MNKTTTFYTIQATQKVFAQHGLPDSIKNAKIPPFQSKELEDYMTSQGIRHHLVKPLWPQANEKWKVL